MIRMFTSNGKTVLSVCCGISTDLVASLWLCSNANGFDTLVNQTDSAAKRLTESESHQHKENVENAENAKKMSTSLMA